MTSAHEQRIAELESAREAHGKESEAAESALRSEMDELRASHAVALEAASAAALSEATEEHKAAASAQQEQMQAEHQDRVARS